jgi:PAS domain S-box-containing protein
MMTSLARILVTDDEPLALSATTRILTSAGYEVFSAINGEQTLQMVEELHPDVLLLDVVLPDIQGTEVCRRLKADPRSADVFIILLSGLRTSSDEQSQGMEGGADGYIVRPIASRELLARIQAYLRVKTAEKRLKEYSRHLEEEAAERKRVENELRLRSEIVDNMSEGVLLIRTRDASIVYLNPASEQLFGYAPQELIGKPVSTINAPTDKSPAQVAEEIIQSLNAHGVWRGEVHNLKKDGTAFFCSANVSTFEHPQYGTVWVAIHQDITARKQVEEAVRASEARFREVLENSLDAAYKRNLQTNAYEYLSPVFERISGFTPQEFVNFPLDTVMGLIHPDDIPEVNRVITTALSDPTHNENWVDYRMKHKVDGEYHWLHDRFSVMRDAAGQPVALIGSVSDITARKQIEEELQRSHSRYDALVRQIPVGVFVYRLYADGRTKYEYVSPRFCQLLDVESEAMLCDPRTAQSNVHPDDLAKLIAANQAAAVSGQAMNVEGRYRIRGETRWMRVDAVPTPLSNGDTLWNGVLTDLTERKQAEDEINQLNATLEQRVTDRTRELRDAQEKLMRQEKLAILGQMAGSVGHELRNPLSVINNAIFYLKLVQPDADAKIKEYLGVIEKQVQISDKIITDLLNFARIKSVDREAVPVPDLVHSTFERFPASANVEVTLDLPAHLPQVFVDPRQMEQVLGNLTTNACQAMPEGGRLSVISEQLSVGSNQWVRIAVKDTGVGIPPENMGRLFEPLFTTKTRGIGLGLAVSRKLAEANGGRIEVESKVGVGTTFTVWLPVSGDQ